MNKPTDIDRNIVPTSRRRFLRNGSALVGGAVIAGGLAGGEALGASESAHNLPPNVPEWMKTPGDPMGSQLYGTPSPFEKGVIKNIPKDLSQYLSASGRTPLQDLDGIITPNGLFYERHHAGVPTIDPAQHRLMLHGLVERPLIFTMDDIRRFPSESHIYFLECSGNPTYEKPYGKTASDLVGLLSCAEWTGVSLKLVLQEAGLQPGAKWVVAEGADSAAMTRSIPIEKCLEDAMLAYSQNGERLRPQQGYPLRLLVPGFEGNMNVKWLRRLHVTAEPAYSREEKSKYSDLMPDGEALQFTFEMGVKSVITKPSSTMKLPRTGFYEVSGIAWSGAGRVRRVEVSTDGGATWAEAALTGEERPKSLVRFRLPWEWAGKEAVLQSRATDEKGRVQPARKAWLAQYSPAMVYHNHSIVSWAVGADGSVKNVYV